MAGNPPTTAGLRRALNAAFDDPGLDAFCQDHYPAVFGRFGRGQRKDEKITLLLDHCQRQPNGLVGLQSLVNSLPHLATALPIIDPSQPGGTLYESMSAPNPAIPDSRAATAQATGPTPPAPPIRASEVASGLAGFVLGVLGNVVAAVLQPNLLLLLAFLIGGFAIAALLKFAQRGHRIAALLGLGIALGLGLASMISLASGPGFQGEPTVTPTAPVPPLFASPTNLLFDIPTALSAQPTETTPLPSLTTTPTTLSAGSTPRAMTALGIQFTFEAGTQSWNTSEGGTKLATLTMTTTLAHSGTAALQVQTELFGSSSVQFAADPTKQPVYPHTEATIYFTHREEVDPIGPYNLQGKRVTCFVYLPPGLITTPPAYIRLFAKDTVFLNHFTRPLDIGPTVVDQWQRLELVIGSPDQDYTPDPGFDPTRVNAIGVRIDTAGQSALSYTGPFYIDDCTVEYP